MAIEILRLPIVKVRTGLSRSTIYLRIADGVFPAPVNLGGRAVGWPSDEIDAVNAAWIGGCADIEIRKLVEQLKAARKTRS